MTCENEISLCTLMAVKVQLFFFPLFCFWVLFSSLFEVIYDHLFNEGESLSINLSDHLQTYRFYFDVSVLTFSSTVGQSL